MRSVRRDVDDADAERGSVVREGLAGSDGACLRHHCLRCLRGVARGLGPSEEL